MGTVVLFKIMAAERAPGNTSLTTGVNTDNQGNSYAVSKHRAKKWPAADIMLELQLTCHFSETVVTASHVKRGSNTWADELSKKDFTGFTPSHRCTLDITNDSNWLVWHELKKQVDA